MKLSKNPEQQRMSLSIMESLFKHSTATSYSWGSVQRIYMNIGPFNKIPLEEKPCIAVPSGKEVFKNSFKCALIKQLATSLFSLPIFH
uniref:Uncharacterized protein n=1 Tax=Ascaris lumbricoides TaxID=6252 RepID=A0A0M3HK69_ASCLU